MLSLEIMPTLRKNREANPPFAMITNLIHPARRLWAWPLLLILILLIAQCFGDAGRSLLAFDHSLIAGGQWWRLITGSYVHLGWYQIGRASWRERVGQ